MPSQKGLKAPAQAATEARSATRSPGAKGALHATFLARAGEPSE